MFSSLQNYFICGLFLNHQQQENSEEKEEEEETNEIQFKLLGALKLHNVNIYRVNRWFNQKFLEINFNRKISPFGEHRICKMETAIDITEQTPSPRSKKQQWCTVQCNIWWVYQRRITNYFCFFFWAALVSYTLLIRIHGALWNGI